MRSDASALINLDHFPIHIDGQARDALVAQIQNKLGNFSYVEEPDMVGTPERVKQLYGRVLPIHLERAGCRADSLID
ncbi:MAG: hypothetical protein ACPHWV_03490 [Candidatus Puniceispirillum sp.]